LAELAHGSPRRLTQPVIRQNSFTNWLRHGASLAFERDVSRSKTIWLTHRPAMRTASNTPAIIHPEKPFV